jgi:NADPH-dependent curcumin reductase CurA
VASRHPNYREGDAVMGMLGWQEYAISDGSTITRKIKERDLPLSLSLGVLGLNGVTAYFGLLDVGQPRRRARLARQWARSQSSWAAEPSV